MIPVVPQEDGSEPCGNFNLQEDFYPSESCAKYFKGEIGCGWIECPRCT